MAVVVAVSSCLYVFPISSNSSFISFWLSVISSMAFLILVYRYIPNTYVSWRSVVVPGFLSSFFITALQYGYAYVQVFLTSYNVIYGSLAVLPLFLIWLQLTWTIVIVASQVRLFVRRVLRWVKSVICERNISPRLMIFFSARYSYVFYFYAGISSRVIKPSSRAYVACF